MAQDHPRRGGQHTTYSLFIGGSDLDNQYRLTGTRHYKYTNQRRGAKVVNSIEQALLKTIDSQTSPKFNGNLLRTPSSQDTELDKLNFIKQLIEKSSCMDNSPSTPPSSNLKSCRFFSTTINLRWKT